MDVESTQEKSTKNYRQAWYRSCLVGVSFLLGLLSCIFFLRHHNGHHDAPFSIVVILNVLYFCICIANLAFFVKFVRCKVVSVGGVRPYVKKLGTDGAHLFFIDVIFTLFQAAVALVQLVFVSKQHWRFYPFMDANLIVSFIGFLFCLGDLLARLMNDLSPPPTPPSPVKRFSEEAEAVELRRMLHLREAEARDWRAKLVLVTDAEHASRMRISRFQYELNEGIEDLHRLVVDSFTSLNGSVNGMEDHILYVEARKSKFVKKFRAVVEASKDEPTFGDFKIEEHFEEMSKAVNFYVKVDQLKDEDATRRVRSELCKVLHTCLKKARQECRSAFADFLESDSLGDSNRLHILITCLRRDLKSLKNTHFNKMSVILVNSRTRLLDEYVFCQPDYVS